METQKALGSLLKCDFQEEYACLGFWVKIQVYSSHQTMGIVACHHMGRCYSIKLIGDGVETSQLGFIREFIRQWLAQKPEAKNKDV